MVVHKIKKVFTYQIMTYFATGPGVVREKPLFLAVGQQRRIDVNRLDQMPVWGVAAWGRLIPGVNGAVR